ncbi:hypothetical protein AcW2_007443 [Taiwanofungus camphoratus]|nr:hypothetical protein AcW2_007443 [Antrodia cinnamomea]
MDPVDHRARREELDPGEVVYSHVKDECTAPHPTASGGTTDRTDTGPTGYTLMVAGRRTGKTSFLRLLLDTSNVSQVVSNDQLTSVAKFVQGCGGHTSHVRTVSVDIDLALGDTDDAHPLTLTLIDTPSLDFEDETSSQRTVTEILRHVDARFAESIDDVSTSNARTPKSYYPNNPSIQERKALCGDHHVHLCIYFLDPDTIIPPSVSAPPMPPVPRARTNSLSHPESEPVILEPPVTTNPLLCRPTLPAADIATIRRLSARVNVLPVVARADMLTNDRLAAVKMAIRRDLAEAGIGFGIFDLDTFPQYPHYINKDATELTAKPPSDLVNGHGNHTNGASSAATSPPSTPITSSVLRLPFALISPDIYSHSDGVARAPPSRHELVLQYTPSKQYSKSKIQTLSKIITGKFIRSYRWGSLDIMDVNHCDFIHLRGAIFHHMQTLQKYTREYLFQKFRAELQLQAPSAHHPLSARAPQQVSRLPPLSHALSVSRPNIAPSGDVASASTISAQPPPVPRDASPRTASSSRSQRQRPKKITVACNFCRSRKLKCDGGRPACSQCFKRSNQCDYTLSHKRRGNGRQRRQQFAGSESEGESIEDPSLEAENPSQSPEVISQPPSRRNSNVNMLLTETLPPFGTAIDRREESSSVLPPISRATSGLLDGPSSEARPELPPITTLSIQSAGSAHDESQPIPSSKPDAQLQRRRTSSATSGKSRTSTHGSKIVACNICRARKTRCDGAHPTCGSCSRRSLPCNYVNDPHSSGGRGRARTTVATPPCPPARSSPSAYRQFTPGEVGTSNGHMRRLSAMDSTTADLPTQPTKKLKMSTDMSAPAIAVAQAQ